MNEPRTSDATDDLGRQVGVLEASARIVSLVPSITELVCELGAGSSLVGATRYCTEPVDAVRGLERVGGTKDPDCDRIIALRPDIVYCDRDENRQEDFERLESAGIRVFVAAPSTVEASATSIRRIGASLGRSEEGAQLADKMLGALPTADAEALRRVRVFCPIWRNPWMCFNQSVFAADLIRQSGGESVCDSEEPYPHVDLAEVLRADPEVILLPDEPYVFRPAHIESLRELATSSAWRTGRIHVVDGKAMFWYGSRTVASLRLLRALFGAVESE